MCSMAAREAVCRSNLGASWRLHSLVGWAAQRLPMLFLLASFFADRTSRKHPWTSCCMLPHHLTIQHLEQLLVLRQQRRQHQQQEQQQQQELQQLEQQQQQRTALVAVSSACG